MPSNDIYLDIREPPDFKAALRAAFAKDDVTITELTLETGDVTWLGGHGMVTVERKTIGDLIGSLRDGRWSTQMARMTKETVPVVLVQGNWTIDKDGNLIPEHRTTTHPPVLHVLVDSSLLVAQWYGIAVARCGDTYQAAARRIRDLYVLSQRETHDSINPITPRTQTILKPGEDIHVHEHAALFILLGFPGIGVKSARAILEYFGSLEAVLTAMLSEQHHTVPSKYRTTFRRARTIMKHRVPNRIKETA